MEEFAETTFYSFADEENCKQIIPQLVVCNQWSRLVWLRFTHRRVSCVLSGHLTLELN